MNGKVQLVKKLSLKSIIGKPDVKALHESGKAIDLFTVGGRLSGKKTGVSQFGEWVAFTGSVGAVRHSDGVEFRGAELFLPEVAEAYVLPVVDDAKGQPVDFAFIIGIEPMTKPSGELSYSYTVKPIVAADAVDPMAELMNKMRANVPTLGAPTTGDATGQTAQAETAAAQSSEQAPETGAAQETAGAEKSDNKRKPK